MQWRNFRAGTLVTATLLSGFASGASAAVVLFQDTFEGDTLGVLPVADIGSYDLDDSNGRVSAYGAAAVSPTPASPNNVFPAAPSGGGLQMLRLQPASGGGRDAALLANPANTAGTLFHLEFDLYVSSSVSFGFGSKILGEAGQTSGLSSPSSGRPRQSFLVNLASGGITVSRDADNNPATANVAVSTGLTYTANEFQKYTIDYVLGSNQLTLTAGSQTPLVITAPFLSATDFDFDSSNGSTPATVPSLSQVDTLFFATGSSGAVGFVDSIVATGTYSIPEPGTLGAAAIVCTLSLALRRRSSRCSI